jgi:hypothetical protein
MRATFVPTNLVARYPPECVNGEDNVGNPVTSSRREPALGHDLERAT